MVTSQKNSLLFAILVATLPGLSFALVMGGDYSQSQGAGPSGQGGQSGGNAGGNASGNAGGGAGGGTGGGSSGSAPASSGKGIGGNVSSVDSILHPSGGGSGKAPVYVIPVPMLNEVVRDKVMDNSINAYNGYCACPYSKNSDGYECGVEAMYYKPGGYRIYCYPQDVRGQLDIFYRKTH